MEVNIVSRKLIKPLTPTPKSLNRYKISFKDELSPPMNVSLVFYYPSKPKENHLEESLAKTLVQFYPLAGRYLKREGIIDCSDQGAEFVEAEITGASLSDLTAQRSTDQLKHLLPRQCHEVDEATDPLLSIQVSEMKSCGGLVIGVCVSHRIFDGYSIATFVAAWSNNGNTNPLIIPTFNSAVLFPGRNLNDCSDDPIPFDDPTISVKRLVFTKEAIASLRSTLKAKDESKVLSRVRVVTALIAKALIRVDRAKRGEPRPTLIAQAVDMRGRTIPPLPKYSCGNLAIQSLLRIETDQLALGIQELVDLMGDAVEKTVSDCARILESAHHDSIIGTETHIMEKSESDDMNVMWFTDWSKFGFHQVDFGWGKPVWASVGALSSKNITVLMNNREGDGMEAWVHLDHHDMAYLQQDDDIKLYTT